MAELDLDLSGRVAVVTGASRCQGIGAAVPRARAAHGAGVLFTHRRPFDRTQPHGVDADGPAALAEELRGIGARAEAMAVDLARPAAAEVLGAAVARLGPPSVLGNTAARFAAGGYEALGAAALDAHRAINLRAMALPSVGFARRYPGGPGGRIVDRSSGQGVGPVPNQLASATSKGAVDAFTASLAVGAAAKGITVDAVDPGGTDVGWMPGEVKAAIVADVRFGRVGQPEDTARLVRSLVGDAGGWFAGRTIHSRGA